MPHHPRGPSQGPADDAAAHEAAARSLYEQAEIAANEPLIGPSNEPMTPPTALTRTEQISAAINHARDDGSLRHILVSPWTTALSFCTVAALDAPIVGYVSAGIFDLDLAHPAGVRLMITIVVTILVTFGAAAALHHCGRTLRHVKNWRRGLQFSDLTLGMWITLMLTCILVSTIATLAWYRIAIEAALSRQGTVALALATLAALVLFVSSGLIAANAFRDGSELTDDLHLLNKRIAKRRKKVRKILDKARHHAEQVRRYRGHDDQPALVDR